MSDSLEQPLWVGFNNPRFPYARYGYLPALEPKEEVEPVEHHIIYHHTHSNLSGKQAHSIENNTNQILALKKIFNDHLGRHKPKGNRYNVYK